MAQPSGRPELSNLTLRVLSAAVLLPLVLAAIWFGNPYFGAMMLVFAAAMMWEFTALCRAGPGHRGLAIATILSAAALTLAGWPREALACIAAGALLTAVTARIGKTESPNLLPVGILYLSLAVFSFIWLRDLPGAGLAMVFWLLAAVIATDVGAYFAGRAIGGPKMAPRISPAKTWSGLAGGMVCAAIAGAAVVAAIAGRNVAAIALLSAVLAAVAQLGDLIESSVKRHFGVKDASNLIPGHGGVLDRVDGFLTVAPVMALMTWLAGRSPLEWQ